MIKCDFFITFGEETRRDETFNNLHEVYLTKANQELNLNLKKAWNQRLWSFSVEMTGRLHSLQGYTQEQQRAEHIKTSHQTCSGFIQYTLILFLFALQIFNIKEKSEVGSFCLNQSGTNCFQPLWKDLDQTSLNQTSVNWFPLCSFVCSVLSQCRLVQSGEEFWVKILSVLNGAASDLFFPHFYFCITQQNLSVFSSWLNLRCQRVLKNTSCSQLHHHDNSIKIKLIKCWQIKYLHVSTETKDFSEKFCSNAVRQFSLFLTIFVFDE